MEEETSLGLRVRCFLFFAHPTGTRVLFWWTYQSQGLLMSLPPGLRGGRPPGKGACLGEEIVGFELGQI